MHSNGSPCAHGISYFSDRPFCFSEQAGAGQEEALWPVKPTNYATKADAVAETYFQVAGRDFTRL